MNDYNQKNILVVVSGSVAAYKSAILVRELIKFGAHVRVAMTSSAQEFITAKTLSVLSQNEVLTDLFAQQDATVLHIEWAQWADQIFVVPATANLIGKIANGIADDAVTAIIMASDADKIIAPAMNDVMLNNPAVQRNIKRLEQDGWLIISPEIGFLAEGYDAKGRLPEPIEILSQTAIRLRARKAKLLNKKVIITAGGTKESIDPVRYITNRSSGKMGFALAQAAVEAGAKVTLISTQKAPQIYGVDVVYVNSAAEMYQQVQSLFVTADIFISAAAVSDYRPANEASQKIKKEGSEGLNLSLVQNVDILSEIGHSKSSNQFVVGFAAETNNLMAYAQKKLKTKQADMLIANDVSRSDVGFNSDDNAITILVPDQKPETTMLLPKIEIARLIMNRIGQTFA